MKHLTFEQRQDIDALMKDFHAAKAGPSKNELGLLLASKVSELLNVIDSQSGEIRKRQSLLNLLIDTDDGKVRIWDDSALAWLRLSPEDSPDTEVPLLVPAKRPANLYQKIRSEIGKALKQCP